MAAEADSISRSRTLKKRAEKTKAHILIVEDSELVTDALRILFEETGRRVTVAHSVAQAVSAGVKDPPDLLLLDLTLPDGDGLDVLLKLAKKGVEPKATVAITGKDDPESMARCAAAHVTEVLVKPVPAKELLSRTKAWLA